MITKQRQQELDLLLQPIIPDVLPATPWDMYLALVGDDSASPGEIYLAKQHADEFISYIDVHLKRFPKSRPGKVIPELGKTRREFYQLLGVTPMRYVRDFAPKKPAEAVYVGKMIERSRGWQGIAKRALGKIEEFESLVGGAMVTYMQKGDKTVEGLPDVPAGKKGRPAKHSLKWRTELVARWKVAGNAGISKMEFCRDEAISTTVLETSLRRVNEVRR